MLSTIAACELPFIQLCHNALNLKVLGANPPPPSKSLTLISKIFVLTYTVIEIFPKHLLTSAINRKHDVGIRAFISGPLKQNNEGIISSSYLAFRKLFARRCQRCCCHQSTREK